MISSPEFNMWHNSSVSLVTIEENDTELITAWWNDREVMQYNVPFALKPWTTKEVEGRIAMRLQDTDEYFWMIEMHPSGEKVGHAGLSILNKSARSGRISILIGLQQHRGKGLGKATLNLLLHYGFGELGMNRIELNVIANNHAAIAAYTKIGFIKEGMLYSAIYRNYTHLDWIQMSILQSEWNP